jgi:hypothetical protein
MRFSTPKGWLMRFFVRTRSGWVIFCTCQQMPEADYWVSKICTNPELKTKGASIAKIASYFNESLTFSDAPQWRKMRDSYPLDFFTLRPAYIVEKEGNADEFLSLFVFALWTVAIENRTRLVIIETLLLFFLIFLMPFSSPLVREQSSVRICTVTVCTLAVQYVALLTNDPHLGLDRNGSHTEENFIIMSWRQPRAHRSTRVSHIWIRSAFSCYGFNWASDRQKQTSVRKCAFDQKGS